MASLGVEPVCYSTSGRIRYLKRLELYKTEKPYEVTFPPLNVTQPGARRTNIALEYWPVEFKDLSTNRDGFSTDIQGFELDHFHTVLSATELQDLDTVQSKYHAEARSFLECKYGAKRVFIFDTTVS
jgi:hypothetical protein